VDDFRFLSGLSFVIYALGLSLHCVPALTERFLCSIPLWSFPNAVPLLGSV
jgi:hypothetical protein